MSQDVIIISVVALVIVVGSCIGLARSGRKTTNEE